MKKIYFLFGFFIALSGSSLFAQTTETRAASTLTTSYVACATTTGDDHQFTVEVFVSGTGEAIIANLKPQWSTDGTNWVDEPVNVSGTASATEQPYTRLSKVFQFSVNSTGLVFGETFNRWGNNRFFRVAIKGASATTTALVQIKVGVSKYAQ